MIYKERTIEERLMDYQEPDHRPLKRKLKIKLNKKHRSKLKKINNENNLANTSIYEAFLKAKRNEIFGDD